MQPLVRSILAPFVVILAAGVIASLFIRHEEQKTAGAKAQSSPAANVLMLRRAAVDAAKKTYEVSLKAEQLAFERESADADLAELAELSHRVRVLRIELEHQQALAAIDKKYPPPDPLPSEPAAP